MSDTAPQAHRAITLVRNSPVPITYVEGMSQMMLGFPNSRVMLHNMSTRESVAPDAPETHQLALELVMPTAALIELCQTVLRHVAEVGPQLKEGGVQWLDAVHRLVESTQPGVVSPENP